MNISINPLTWFSSIEKLRAKSQGFDSSLRQLFNDVAQWAQQIQAQFNPTVFASFLNGNQAILSTGLSQVSLRGLTETVNRTVNTNSAAVVCLNLTVTGAINYTLTLNNVASGALVLLRLVNSSGASRTFTVAANTPASVAYGVSLIGTGAPLSISAGVSIASAAAWNGLGTTIVSVPQILLVGGVGT